MNKTSKYNSRRRNQNGSLIAEGAAGLVLITSGVVCAVLLLINAGLSFYYKEKLGFVCDQAARYAASKDKSTREAVTKTYVNELVQAIGLPADQIAIEIKEKEIGGSDHVGVHIEANFGLISDGRVIPGFLRLGEDSLVNTGNGSGGDDRVKGYALIQQGGVGGVDEFIAIPIAWTGRSSSAHGSMMGKLPKTSKPVFQIITNAPGGLVQGPSYGQTGAIAERITLNNSQGSDLRDSLP